MSKEIKLEEVCAFVAKAHQGQTRWNGDAYATHPIAVSKAMDIFPAVALLHDVIEDTDYTYDDIRERFGIRIANAVQIISKNEGESYSAFIRRIKNSRNPVAIAVKISDLEHNLSDLKKGSMRDKYELALDILNCEYG